MPIANCYKTTNKTPLGVRRSSINKGVKKDGVGYVKGRKHYRMKSDVTDVRAYFQEAGKGHLNETKYISRKIRHETDFKMSNICKFY